MSPPRQQPLLAFAVALAAVAVLSVMDAVMKGLVLAIGLYATSLWRALVGVGLSAILYLPQRRSWPSRKVVRLHVLRGAVVTVMGLLFFFGLARVPMAQAIALTFIAPLIALVPGLDDPWRTRRAPDDRCVAAGLRRRAGDRWRPGRTELGEGVLVGTFAILGSAVCYAVNIVMMRRQSLAAKPLEIGFFQNITVATLMVAAIPSSGQPAWPGDHWPGIITVAMMSFAGVLSVRIRLCPRRGELSRRHRIFAVSSGPRCWAGWSSPSRSRPTRCSAHR